jgi:magnesium transporter
LELKYHHAAEIPHDLGELFKGKNMWVEISSIDEDLIRDVLTYFDAHQFVIDDIQTLEQRMKISVLNEDIYLLLDLIYLNETNYVIEQQKISFYLIENTLITIQEYRTHKLFLAIKYRLSKKTIQSKGRLKKMKIDYLFYCLLNVVIENYMDVLDSILYKTEILDTELMFSTKPKADIMNVETLKSMFHIKHELLHFKVVCAPLKDIIIKLQKTRETVVPKRQRTALRQCRRRLKRRLRLGVGHNCSYTLPSSTSVGSEDDEYTSDDGVLVLNDYIYKYFKRLLDHTVELNDTIDSYADTITSLIDFYMILNGELTNDTIQTLTVMSCIFMPLNFLSSLSSMNFAYMVQIPMRYGYFGQLGLMGVIALIMIVWFKWKKLI